MGDSGSITVTIDGADNTIPQGSTILEACRTVGHDIPTLCFLETLTPASTCRLCVVEVEGTATLAPACSRIVEPGMVIQTGSDRVRAARRMVLELLASSVDLSVAPELHLLIADYGAEPERHGRGAVQASAVALVPPVVDNDLFVRDLAKCVLCYRCVEACGDDAQHTYAISIAGRGFESSVATEYDVSLPDSACVFCGNCVAVCPTGALMVTTEHNMRRSGTWHADQQSTTRTVCAFCGVGCNLDLHVQDGRIVKVTSPFDHEVTLGNLCIKGRFGWQHVHLLDDPP